MIVDRQGRRFRNLRISLTSACNYACTYCVPNGKRLVAAQDELSAEAMGGEIRVQSKLGEGSTFTLDVDLPVAEGQIETVPPVSVIPAENRALPGKEAPCVHCRTSATK